MDGWMDGCFQRLFTPLGHIMSEITIHAMKNSPIHTLCCIKHLHTETYKNVLIKLD
uniref:Uncharacterized protein n=1 Tax=Anguilla anguilla TaxID=7936 RepID=A0A0E9WVW3_ANGAN